MGNIPFAALAVVLVSACFPDPPKDDTSLDVVDDTEDSASDSVQGDAAEDSADTESPADGDATSQDTDDTTQIDTAETKDTSDTTDAIDITDSSDGDTIEDGADADTVSNVDTQPPECAVDDDCVHLDDECLDGTCDHGTCVQSPLSGDDCDDEQACTEGDVCDAGACKGIPIACEAIDQCHEAGECNPDTGICSDPVLTGIDCDDAMKCTDVDACDNGECKGTPVTCTKLDQCSDIGECSPDTGLCSNPPNTGDDCDDDLKCTENDTCNQGVCQGTEIVCTARDQCHDAGECDPATGVCSDPNKPDTTACDDGQKCTENDACTNGVCGSDPVVCTPVDDCHDEGVCNPANGTCSSPLMPINTPCDDANFCTVNEKCNQGVCAGGSRPSNTNDYLVTVATDKTVEIHAIAEEPNGDIVAIGLAEGTTITTRNRMGTDFSMPLPANEGCELIRIDVKNNGYDVAAYFLGGATECHSDKTITAGIGLYRLADGTYLTGGFYSGGPYKLHGRTRSVGTSPSGFLQNYGTWIGRLKSFTSFAWVVDVFGSGFDLEMPHRALSVSPLGSSIVAVPTATSMAFEVIYDNDDSEVILNEEAGDLTAWLLELTGTGRLSRTAKMTCNGQPDCIVVPLAAARSTQGNFYVGGTTVGGSTTFGGLDGSSSLTVPTGLGSDFEGWLVSYTSDGVPVWGRHFFPSVTAGNYAALVLGLSTSGSEIHGVGSFTSIARTRVGTAAAAYLVPAEAGTVLSKESGYWFSLDAGGAVISGGHFNPEGTFSSNVVTDADRVVVAGITDGTQTPGPLADDFDNVFVKQVGSWERLVADPSTTTEVVCKDVDGASPTPITVSDHGITMATGISTSCTVGVGQTLAITPPALGRVGIIMRVNSARALECP